MFDKKLFIANLVHHREKAGRNRQQQAAWLGVYPPTYYQWEAGRSEPNVGNFLHLCNELGLQPSHYYTGPE